MVDVIDTGYEVSLKSHKYVTATGSVVLQATLHTTDTKHWILQTKYYFISDHEIFNKMTSTSASM